MPNKCAIAISYDSPKFNTEVVKERVSSQIESNFEYPFQLLVDGDEKTVYVVSEERMPDDVVSYLSDAFVAADVNRTTIDTTARAY